MVRVAVLLSLLSFAAHAQDTGAPQDTSANETDTGPSEDTALDTGGFTGGSTYTASDLAGETGGTRCDATGGAWTGAFALVLAAWALRGRA